MGRLEDRKKERDISLASVLDSMYALAEEYLLQDKNMKEKYETEFMDLLFPDDEKEIMLDAKTQGEISNVVYGRERAISSITFLLGMQFGIKYISNIKEDDIIKMAIDSNIIV